MTNQYYDHSTYPAPNASGSSAQMRAELELIEAGFAKLPTLAGNGGKLVRVNILGTAMEAVSDLGGITINGVPIGGTTAAAGRFTTLTATGLVTFERVTGLATAIEPSDAVPLAQVQALFGSSGSAAASAAAAAASAAAAAAAAAGAGQALAIPDNLPHAKNSVDPTKTMRNDLSALPTATQIVNTWRNLSGTVALLADLTELARASTYFDSAATTALNYNNGGRQRCAPATGAKTISITNWPVSGKHAVQLIELVNGADGGIPSFGAGARYIKGDGTLQTTAAAAGIIFQASGTDYVMVFTRDAGATSVVSVLRG